MPPVSVWHACCLNYAWRKPAFFTNAVGETRHHAVAHLPTELRVQKLQLPFQVCSKCSKEVRHCPLASLDDFCCINSLCWFLNPAPFRLDLATRSSWGLVSRPCRSIMNLSGNDPEWPLPLARWGYQNPFIKTRSAADMSCLN